jgi:hypothetical protein
VEIDRLRSGKAFRAVDYPFAGPQTACHTRLPDSHGPISFLTGFNFENAVTPVLYEPHKFAMSTAFATSYTLLRRDICGWAALFRF